MLLVWSVNLFYIIFYKKINYYKIIYDSYEPIHEDHNCLSFVLSFLFVAKEKVTIAYYFFTVASTKKEKKSVILRSSSFILVNMFILFYNKYRSYQNDFINFLLKKSNLMYSILFNIFYKNCEV